MNEDVGIYLARQTGCPGGQGFLAPMLDAINEAARPYGYQVIDYGMWPLFRRRLAQEEKAAVEKPKEKQSP